MTNQHGETFLSGVLAGERCTMYVQVAKILVDRQKQLGLFQGYASAKLYNLYDYSQQPMIEHKIVHT